MPTTSKDSIGEDEGLRCLFRGYLRYATVFCVVIVESAVGIPLRRVFRHAWMDVKGIVRLIYILLYYITYSLYRVQRRRR